MKFLSNFTCIMILRIISLFLSDISLKKDKAVSEKSKDQDDQVVVRKWQTGAIVVSRLTEFSPENTPSKSRVRS